MAAEGVAVGRTIPSKEDLLFTSRGRGGKADPFLFKVKVWVFLLAFA